MNDSDRLAIAKGDSVVCVDQSLWDSSGITNGRILVETANLRTLGISLDAVATVTPGRVELPCDTLGLERYLP